VNAIDPSPADRGFDAAGLSHWFGERLGLPASLAFRASAAELADHAFAAACPAGLVRSPRRLEWIAARCALAEVLPRGRSAIDERFPSRDASLAHSGGLAVAACIADAEGCGIDLERPRRMDPASARHFLTREEQDALRAGQDLLLLWTIKEAVFKADRGNMGRVLSGYRLDALEGRGTARRVDDESSRFRYAARCLDDGWRIAVAVGEASASVPFR
jgi:4'-phosphopantetheinyl transferase EntD